MNRTLYILLIYCILPAAALKAQYSNIEFIENKGQWDSRVKFSGQVNAGNFYVEKNGFMVVQHNPEDWAKIGEVTRNHGAKSFQDIKNAGIVIHSHAYNVEFLNGNQSPELLPDKALPGTNNYFIGNDPTKWAADCKVYQGITMKNVYPNVDVRYYSDNGAVKYDLVIKPGADISRIALKYRGVDKLEIKNRELIINTTVGKLKELNPYSYQQDMKGKREITCKYKLKDNVVSFAVSNYDPSSTIIIDPSLVFCSFTGSTADNWGFTATYGPDGSMFGGGIVFNSGFPVTPGAFQTVFAGGDVSGSGWGAIDIGIIKLSPNGSTRIFATYLGGSGNELPQSLICDPQGNLIVAGRSNSPDYPTKPANNVNGTAKGFDIIITKINANGNGLIGSKKIGGNSDDGSNITPYGGGANSLQRNYGDEARSEVILDNAGNIYLASCTQSMADASGNGGFPVVGGFQPTSSGGPHSQDAVVLKISPDVSTLLFSTYLGGTGDDAAYVLSISPVTGNLYVAGGTSSNNFPGNHTSVIGPATFGGIDGFVAEISGTTLVRSTYLGTSGIDQVYGIQFDKNGFPYVTGQTTGSWPFVAPPGIASPFNQPGGKQFIAKMQPDLSAYIYSITFGTSSLPNISPTAFLVDRCENVYVSGWGGCFNCNSPENSGYPNSGTFGLPVTPDAIKGSTDGKDFYFFVLKKNAVSQLYGSFFGENNVGGCDHVDGGTSRFDDNGVIYQAICANCKELDPGAVFPVTPGVAGPINPANSGGKCNLALVKIAFNLAGVKAGIESTINGVPRDSSGCVPLTVDFTDTIQNALSYEWTFGDGSPKVNTTAPASSHTYNAIGSYIVMLVAIDSTTCNIRDTSYVHIRVGDIQAIINFTPVKLNPCDSFKYRFDNTSTAPLAFGNASFTWDFGDGSPRVVTGTTSVFHNYAAPGTYNVRLVLTDTAYCNAPDSVTVQLRVAALVKAQFTTPPAGCAPYSAAFTNTSLAGQTFQWDFGDGATSTDINPTHLYTVPGNYTITLIANDPGTCNLTDTTTLTIAVAPIPVADFSFTPDPPVENTPTTFTNISSIDAIRFIWQFGDGDTLSTTSRLDVLHQYNATGTYNTCLIAFNAAGCSDTTCKQVSALVVPAVDVPNAFTPLSGSINSRVLVKGFGITKLRFIIWNRWGQKVFETNDKNLGWDGKLNGVVQPMDVYAYTLDVEFFDGKKATKKGDITLIR